MKLRIRLALMTFDDGSPRQRASDDAFALEDIVVGKPVYDSADGGILTPTAKNESEIAFSLAFRKQKKEGTVKEGEPLRLEAVDGPNSVFYRLEFVKE